MTAYRRNAHQSLRPGIQTCGPGEKDGQQALPEAIERPDRHRGPDPQGLGGVRRADVARADPADVQAAQATRRQVGRRDCAPKIGRDDRGCFLQAREVWDGVPRERPVSARPTVL